MCIRDRNPTIYLKKNVGGIPQKDRLPLTDEQVDKELWREDVKGVEELYAQIGDHVPALSLRHI